MFYTTVWLTFHSSKHYKDSTTKKHKITRKPSCTKSPILQIYNYNWQALGSAFFNYVNVGNPTLLFFLQFEIYPGWLSTESKYKALISAFNEYFNNMEL